MTEHRPETAPSNFQAREAAKKEQAKKIFEAARGILDADDIMTLTTVFRDALSGKIDPNPDAYFKKYDKQDPAMMARAEKIHGLLRQINALALADEHNERSRDRAE